MAGGGGCGQRSAQMEAAAGRGVRAGDRKARGKKVMARYIAQTFGGLPLTVNGTGFPW
jgi:hypothetical protein